MIRLLSPSSPHVLAAEFVGVVSRSEGRRFLAALRRAVREHGRIGLLLDVSRLHAFEHGVVSDAVAFAATDPRAVRRVAVVGDGDWAAWTVVMAARYLRTHPQWFQAKDRPLAERFVWLQDLTA